MTHESKTTPPELIRAKKVLDAILAVKPSFTKLPTSEAEDAEISRRVYHERLTIIYLELVNTAAEARSEQRRI